MTDNTKLQDLMTMIENQNTQIGNTTIDSNLILNVTKQYAEKMSDLGSRFADTFYVINLSKGPIGYCREDGIVTQVSNRPTRLLSRELEAALSGSIVIVNCRRVDLIDFDSSIGRKVDGDTVTNMTAAARFNLFREKTTTARSHSFKYQEDMDRLIFNKINGLTRMHRESHHDEYDDVVQCISVYAIDPAGFSETQDTYVPHLNMMFRKLYLEHETSAYRGVKTISTSINTRNTPMTHPMTPITSVDVLKGINGSLLNSTFVQTLEVRYWNKKTMNDLVFLVKDGRVIQLPVRMVDTQDEECIMVYEKDSKGVISPISFELSEMKKFNIYTTLDEATDFLNRDEQLRSIDKETIAAKIREQEATRRKAEEEEKNAKILGDKNNLGVKSDVLKLVGQVVGVIAAASAAIVGLMKLFSPSKFFSGFAGFFGFGSAT